MGLVDRITRLVIAIALVIFYLTGFIGGTGGVVLLAFAIIFALTSLVSVCPLYLPFGLSTLNNKTKNESNYTVVKK